MKTVFISPIVICLYSANNFPPPSAVIKQKTVSCENQYRYYYIAFLLYSAQCIFRLSTSVAWQIRYPKQF